MRPNTSVRQPIIAGVRGQTLSDLLRAWRSQPRKHSPGLFWGLIALAFVVDTALLLVVIHLLGLADPVPASPPSERRMHVLHARNAALWEPLRHWVVRIDGQPRIFDSFCRDAVRAITGDERFENNDPLPVVVAWMLHDATPRDARPDFAWDDYPFLRCDDAELRALLSCDEQYLSQMSSERHRVHVEPSVLRQARSFHKVLRGIAAKGGSAPMARLSPLEKQAVEVENRLALFERIRSGLVDGGDGEEMEAASAALREAYHSGSADLFAAALADFVGASRRALPVDEAAANRLACEDWLNERHPFRQARILSILAAGLLAVALLAGVRRPAWRRGGLVSGLLACAGCLGWSAAGFFCRAILHDGAPVSAGPDVVLWIAALAMGLGLMLALLCRDAFLAVAGALVSVVGFVLVEHGPPTLPAGIGDARLSWQVLTALAAYAALALAWGVALLTLSRLVLAPPSSERLRRLAALCARVIGIGLTLLAAGAILGAFRATPPSGAGRGWDAPALGAFFALPGCAVLLYARRVGWLQPFGLLLASALGCTAIVMAWHVLCRGAWDGRAAFDLAANAWLYAACLVNLSLMVHAALRYYFGKQLIIGH